MRTKAEYREEKLVLKLLRDLPDPAPEVEAVWMHEPSIVFVLYGRQSAGVRRRVRKLLKRLEDRGIVERRNWEMGVSWRLSDKR